MRIALIVKMFRDQASTVGVFRKYQDIQNALIGLNHSCDLIYPSSRGVMCNDEFVGRRGAPKNYSKRTTQVIFEKLLIKNIDFGMYDVILFRYHLSTPWLLSALNRIKSRNPSVKIVIEIPTYPYVKEHKGLIGFIRKMVDKVAKNYLKQYVDYIVTFSNHDEIFSIPCINIMNGIDCGRFSLIQFQDKNSGVNLIAIGNLWDWYGLDRVLSGLGLYYQSNPQKIVKLVIIGEGKEKERLAKIAKRNKLEDYVKFVGSLNETECDEYFDKAQIGIGTLAAHRKGLVQICSIKHREYACRGIPFIYAGIDKAFTSISCTKNYEPNDQPINIQSLIDFIGTISDNCTKELQGYACKELSWIKQVSKILDVVESS